MAITFRAEQTKEKLARALKLLADAEKCVASANKADLTDKQNVTIHAIEKTLTQLQSRLAEIEETLSYESIAPQSTISPVGTTFFSGNQYAPLYSPTDYSFSAEPQNEIQYDLQSQFITPYTEIAENFYSTNDEEID